MLKAELKANEDANDQKQVKGLIHRLHPVNTKTILGKLVVSNSKASSTTC